VAEALISPARVILPTPEFSVTVPALVALEEEVVLALMAPVVIPVEAFSVVAPPLPPLLPVLEFRTPVLVLIAPPLLLRAIVPPDPESDDAEILEVVMLPVAAS
jgi:hypothetical protein